MRLIDADTLLDEYDKIHIGEPGRARKLIAEQPTIDAVIDQIRWERDTAIEQLFEIGKGLGEPMDDVAKVVRCKDCKYYNTIGICIETSTAVCEDSFCCWGERRTDE